MSIIEEQIERIQWIMRQTGTCPTVLDLPPKEFQQMLDEMGSDPRTLWPYHRPGEHGVTLMGTKIIKNRQTE